MQDHLDKLIHDKMDDGYQFLPSEMTVYEDDNGEPCAVIPFLNPLGERVFYTLGLVEHDA